MPLTDNLPAENTNPWYAPLNTAWTNLKAFVNGLETTLTSLASDVSGKADTSALTSGLASKANIASPTFTGTVGGITKAMVGLPNVDNTTDVGKPVSTAQAAALALKAPLASPAFTGTPTGITKAHVGLGNVDNTADANKPVSTAQAAALALKADKTEIIVKGVIAHDAVPPSNGVWLRRPAP